MFRRLQRSGDARRHLLQGGVDGLLVVQQGLALVRREVDVIAAPCSVSRARFWQHDAAAAAVVRARR